MRRIGAASLLALAGAGTTPDAPALPVYDLEAYCAQTIPPGLPVAADERLRCLNEERSAHDDLRPWWGALHADTRRRCDDVAQASGGGSYVVLHRCVEEAEHGSPRW